MPFDLYQLPCVEGLEAKKSPSLSGTLEVTRAKYSTSECPWVSVYPLHVCTALLLKHKSDHLQPFTCMVGCTGHVRVLGRTCPVQPQELVSLLRKRPFPCTTLRIHFIPHLDTILLGEDFIPYQSTETTVDKSEIQLYLLTILLIFNNPW